MSETAELIYVPGSFRCPKCGFQLQKRVISARTGMIGIRKDDNEASLCPNDLTLMVALTWKEAFLEMAGHDSELMIALFESVKLQSHYAGLLNQYDGGSRLQFESAADWIERLKATGTIKRKSE